MDDHERLLRRLYEAFNVDDVEASRDGAGVVVRQVVRDLEGQLIDESRRRHVYTFEDGLVSRMEIEEV